MAGTYRALLTVLRRKSRVSRDRLLRPGAWTELHSTGDGTSISYARAYIYYIGVAVSCADGASVEGRKKHDVIVLVLVYSRKCVYLQPN